MGYLLQTLGCMGLVFAIAYFVIYDRMEGTTVDYVRNTRDFALVSATMLVGGFLMKRLAPVFGFGQGRCKVCSKRIEKQEMYCFDHRLQSIRDAQDRTHTAEGRRST